MRTGLWAGLCVALGLACASTQSNQKSEAASPAQSGAALQAAAAGAQPVANKEGEDVVFVDDTNDFEIQRPSSQWTFASGEELSTESISVPVVVANSQHGAQVVVQIAPAVATPAQFAERLTEGLSSRAGFQTSEVKPIPLADGAVGFDFQVGDQVSGRVAILEGTEQRVYVLLATWPQNAPKGIEGEIDQIFGSMKTRP